MRPDKDATTAVGAKVSLLPGAAVTFGYNAPPGGADGVPVQPLLDVARGHTNVAASVSAAAAAAPTGYVQRDDPQTPKQIPKFSQSTEAQIAILMDEGTSGSPCSVVLAAWPPGSASPARGSATKDPG